MMLDRMEGNAELKTSVQQMLATRRLTHSVLLVGEAGLGTGFAARCIAADYLYPAGGAAAEALLRGECCRAVAKAGATAVRWRPASCGKPSRCPVWAAAGSIWWVRSLPCAAKFSTPASPPRVARCFCIMWSA